jgi:hypothetical protein
VKDESDKGLYRKKRDRKMNEKDIKLKETKQPDNLRK